MGRNQQRVTAEKGKDESGSAGAIRREQGQKGDTHCSWRFRKKLLDGMHQFEDLVQALAFGGRDVVQVGNVLEHAGQDAVEDRSKGNECLFHREDRL